MVAAAALSVTACKGTAVSTTPAVPGTEIRLDRAPLAQEIDDAKGHKIQHVVIIVQENRSFNNLFYGYPGAKTAKFGLDSKGNKIVLKPITLATSWDLAHNSIGYLQACNGKGKIPGTHCRMNGFAKEAVTCGIGSQPRCPILHPQYAYVPHQETKPYFDIANQYVLADEMFASNFDASSFVSHQYIIAAQASSTLNYPDSYWGCEGGKLDKIWRVNQTRGYAPQIPVCFDNKTLGDELDDARLPWAFYSSPIQKGLDREVGDTGLYAYAPPDAYKESNGIWSAYQAIRHIFYGKDWKEDVITPQTRFFDDVAHGQLRAVTWITPTCANSDHAGCNSDTGPAWVASLVNAVGESKFWNSTVIFIFWDDYGGWYDPKPPTFVDYDGLGMRVPMLVVSPYTKKGYISHIHYEHGSILKFIEDRFGLPRLSASDKRANSPDPDCFDFSQPPRKFVPIHAPHDATYFKNQPVDLRPPDTD
jgi:phospholipase C